MKYYIYIYNNIIIFENKKLMEKINDNKKGNKETEKIRNKNDVCIGYFFLIFGYFFFVFITFWLITSKIDPPKEDVIVKLPYIIQFFIKDKIYGIILIIIIPTIPTILALKKFVLYSFRH